MKPTVPRLAIALAALIAFPLAAGETKGKTAEKPAAPAAEAAVKIHVDPATGQIVSPKSDPDAARGVSATSTAQPLPPPRREGDDEGGRKEGQPPGPLHDGNGRDRQPRRKGRRHLRHPSRARFEGRRHGAQP